MPSKGHPVADFVSKHFTHSEKVKNKSGWSFFTCRFCPGSAIEHYEGRLAHHIIDPSSCPNATEEAWTAAQASLISWGFIDQTLTLLDLNHQPSNTNQDSEAMGIKKRKSDSTLHTFMDRKMTEAQERTANVLLFQYAINILSKLFTN